MRAHLSGGEKEWPAEGLGDAHFLATPPVMLAQYAQICIDGVLLMGVIAS